MICYSAIRDFVLRYKEVEDQLNNWYAITRKGDWSNFNELKDFFNSVDAVGDDLYVFNIKGNKYRIIVRIIFRVRTVYIKFIGTHKQYDEVHLQDL